jgi:hypothetical protein
MCEGALNMASRWTSRKFLTTVAAQLSALAVLLWPGHADEIRSVTPTVVALLVMLLSSLGYVHAEASIDRQRGS